MADGVDVPLGSSLPSERRYTEHFDCCQMGGGLGGWGKDAAEIKKYKLDVTRQSWGRRAQLRVCSQ